jgi:LacI family kdg operon repressor
MAALASYQVEGFILNTLGQDPGVAAEARRLGRPVVLVDRRHSSMQADFVSLDNAQAMRAALDHLQQQGFAEL